MTAMPWPSTVMPRNDRALAPIVSCESASDRRRQRAPFHAGGGAPPAFASNPASRTLLRRSCYQIGDMGIVFGARWLHLLIHLEPEPFVELFYRRGVVADDPQQIKSNYDVLEGNRVSLPSGCPISTAVARHVPEIGTPPLGHCFCAETAMPGSNRGRKLCLAR